jgi:hypothetical protein
LANFGVEVVTAPPAGGDFGSFKPDWSKYKVIACDDFDYQPDMDLG